MKKIFFVLTLMLVLNSFLIAQPDSSKHLSFRTNLFFGDVVPEYNFYNYLIQKPALSVECSLIKRTTKKDMWHQLYNFPEYGLTVFYTTIGNKDVFGNEIAVFPYVHFF